MYVVGGLDENELMLFNVALAMRDTLLLMLRYVEATQGPPDFRIPLRES
jgi:hypothetical protein